MKQNPNLKSVHTNVNANPSKRKIQVKVHDFSAFVGENFSFRILMSSDALWEDAYSASMAKRLKDLRILTIYVILPAVQSSRALFSISMTTFTAVLM